MNSKIRVAVLDDHQATINGYRYLIQQTADIELVKELYYGEDLEPGLMDATIDVLILDANVPTSTTNPDSYPVLYMIARLLNIYPEMTIIVISMHATPTLIEAALEAGANGYILKDDQTANRELPSIIRALARGYGGLFLSREAKQAIAHRQGFHPEERLPPREMQALSLCATYPDESTASIAQRMGIAPSTLRNTLSNIYLKLGVNNKSAAIVKALQIGWVLPSPKAIHPPPDIR